MKPKELIKEIKGVFILPKKRYYFGRVMFGTPYFFPWNYCGSIIRIYKQVPQFSRLKYFKLGSHYIAYGYPIKISRVELGWKDKYGTPRFEWAPQFQINAFGLQFCIFWNSPDGNDGRYYEMVLHYLYYADKDIKKAKETWNWVDFETKKSTWNGKYLVNMRKEKLKKLMN